MNIVKRDRAGFTLTEVIVVLVILSILAAVEIPSLVEFISKTKEKALIWEAEGVFRSVDLYMIMEYQGDEVDIMSLMDEVSTYPVTSTKNSINRYLPVTCTKGARITGFFIEEDNSLQELEYQVNGYLITVSRGAATTIKKMP